MSLPDTVQVMLWLQWCLVAGLGIWVWFYLGHSPTRYLLLGVLALWTLRGLVGLAGLSLLSAMMDTLFPVASMVVVVLFQPELRAYLMRLGRRLEWVGRTAPWLHTSDAAARPVPLEVVCEALEYLGQNKVGALVVLSRHDPIEHLLRAKVDLDARISRELILSLFVTDKTSGLPDLHDGAAVLVGDRCRWAGAVLPLTEQQPPGRRVGTRHRAALGITEQSDAIAIVVSENGRLSVAAGGVLSPLPARMHLVDHVRQIANQTQESASRAKS